MRTRRARPPLAGVAALITTLALTAVSCEKTHDDRHAPILDPSHSGWKNAVCDNCHTLPVAGHSASVNTECAACHGGNGACDPNGADSARSHNASEDCVTCHATQHGYTAAADCTTCHFATVGGVVGCADTPLPDGGLPGNDAGATDGGAPILPTDLTSGCFDWPSTDFGSSNHVQTLTALPAGSVAVDFTLRDLDGVQHTLSELLATRPVLMVHGAFT